MIFSAILVRASKEYHNNSFGTNDVRVMFPTSQNGEQSEEWHAPTRSTSRSLTILQEHCTRFISWGKTWTTMSHTRVEQADEMEKGRSAAEIQTST